ncbi:unnamed protein product [Somion occarium]|uniref:Uncharacterized protein n=1 Tax=Somion occarium TaxID=3059160 RepID=A0ABP1CKU6_9APHY
MNTWLASTLTSTKTSGNDKQNLLDPRSSAVKQGPLDGGIEGDDRPSLDRALTAALPTPHDVILSQLRGSKEASENAAVVSDENQRSFPPRSSTTPNVGPLEHPDLAPGDGVTTGRRSSAPTPLPATLPERDALYDPFTGAPTGVVFAQPADRQQHEGKKSSEEFNQAKDDLWGHLGRIRELQGEIAGMHVQMEGLGLNDGGRGNSKRPAGVPARMASDTIGVDEWVDTGDDDKSTKTARDAEFSNLSETFEGRRAAIDGIMNKLDELSKALTTFHALPTPVVDFSAPASGNSARGSHSMSPVLQSPSPLFSNPNSPSPTSSPVSPVPEHPRMSTLLRTGVAKTNFASQALSDSPTSNKAP